MNASSPNPNDPLPEGQWLFRRIYVWSLTVLLLALTAFAVWRSPPGQLQLIALWLIGLIGLIATYYLLAPSAPELARLIAEFRTRISLRGRDQIGPDR